MVVVVEVEAEVEVIRRKEERAAVHERRAAAAAAAAAERATERGPGGGGKSRCDAMLGAWCLGGVGKAWKLGQKRTVRVSGASQVGVHSPLHLSPPAGRRRRAWSGSVTTVGSEGDG